MFMKNLTLFFQIQESNDTVPLDEDNEQIDDPWHKNSSEYKFLDPGDQ